MPGGPRPWRWLTKPWHAPGVAKIQSAGGCAWRSFGPDEPWVTVVGVVGDDIIDAHKAPMPGIYLPCAQNPERAMTFVARTLTPPLGLEEPLKRALWAVDKDQPIEQVQTVEQMMSQEFGSRMPWSSW